MKQAVLSFFCFVHFFVVLIQLDVFVLLPSFILLLGAADRDLSKCLGFDSQLFSVTQLDLRKVLLWSDE